MEPIELEGCKATENSNLSKTGGDSRQQSLNEGVCG